MEPTSSLRIHAAPHPDPQVRRAGFPLDHRYVEQCWAAVLGPSSILLLRRASELWEQELSPKIPVRELSSMIGLGHSHGRKGVMWRTLDRLERFKLAEITGPSDITIFTEVPPLSPTQLGRVPTWTRDRHYVLLDAHLAELADLHRGDVVERAVGIDGDGVARPNEISTGRSLSR